MLGEQWVSTKIKVVVGPKQTKTMSWKTPNGRQTDYSHFKTSVSFSAGDGTANAFNSMYVSHAQNKMY